MKNTKIIILIIIAILALSGYLWYKMSQDKPLGSDRDEHGCIGSAGYVWCEAKNKCIRPWEEDCE